MNINLPSKLQKFPWKNDMQMLKKWQSGKTGFPIVDAAMMELWNYGYMHNRARLIVGSFLTKNLLIHWKYGKQWFDDCLFDADQANNLAGWLWVSGAGIDSAPYFRIFNVILQSKKFDPEGEYIKQYLPILNHIDPQYIHDPVTYREYFPADYPEPMIDLKTSYHEALSAYSSMKENH